MNKAEFMKILCVAVDNASQRVTGHGFVCFCNDIERKEMFQSNDDKLFFNALINHINKMGEEN